MRYLKVTLFAVAVSLCGHLSAQGAPAAGKPFTGTIFTATGVVEYQKGGAGEWLIIAAPHALEIGDKVRTGPGSVAEIYVKNGGKVRLFAGSTFVLDKADNEESSVAVLIGKMQAWVRKAANRKFSVRTPAAVCAIRGTVFEVEVAETGETVWNLFTGAIRVSDNQNNSRDLAPNQRVTVTRTAGVAKPEPLPAEIKAPEEPKKIKEERAEIKAEQKEEQKKGSEATKEEVKTEVAEESTAEVVEVAVPETTVIPSQTVQESCEVSASTPDCN